MAYSILIVDDDRTFVEELKSALQWNRLRITEVYTAFSVTVRNSPRRRRW